MKLRIALLLTVSIALVQVRATESPDVIVSDLIISLIDNPGTAELKPISVGELEQRLRAVVAIQSTGRADDLEGYVSALYSLRLKGKEKDRTAYGMEILARGPGEISALRVANVRLSFVAPSGLTYYYSFNADAWPLEREHPLSLKRSKRR